MYVSICMNVKSVILIGIIGGLSYMLYTKDAKIKSLTRDIEEMEVRMKGV